MLSEMLSLQMKFANQSLEVRHEWAGGEKVLENICIDYFKVGVVLPFLKRHQRMLRFFLFCISGRSRESFLAFTSYLQGIKSRAYCKCWN